MIRVKQQLSVKGPILIENDKKQRKLQKSQFVALQHFGKVKKSKYIHPNVQEHDKLIICIHIYIYTHNKNHISPHHPYMGPGPGPAPCKDIWFLLYVCIWIQGYVAATLAKTEIATSLFQRPSPK